MAIAEATAPSTCTTKPRKATMAKRTRAAQFEWRQDIQYDRKQERKKRKPDSLRLKENILLPLVS
jgi:hypothetical protein